MIVNFPVVKASAEYTCKCSECGKTLRRKEVVEHTVNPFNTNSDGSARTRHEVRMSAASEAERRAAEKEGIAQICRDCEDAPNRRLLLLMAETPDAEFPESDVFWGAPMQVLRDRGHVEQKFKRCACGADCCSGFSRKSAFKITAKGIERAAKIKRLATPLSAHGG